MLPCGSRSRTWERAAPPPSRITGDGVRPRPRPRPESIAQRSPTISRARARPQNCPYIRLRTLGLGAVAIPLLVAFVVRQARAANPLLPLGLFRSRNASGANLLQVLMVAGMFGMFFLGALYLQRVLGYDPLRIGLAFLPVAVIIGALSFRFSARLNTRFGARPVLLVGLTLIVVGLALFARARSTPGTSWTSCRRWCCSGSAEACRSRRR